MKTLAGVLVVVVAAACLAFSAGARPKAPGLDFAPAEIGFETRAARDLLVEAVKRARGGNRALATTDSTRSLDWLKRAIADAGKAAQTTVEKQLEAAERADLLGNGYLIKGAPLVEFLKESDVAIARLDAPIVRLERLETIRAVHIILPPTVPKEMLDGLAAIDTTIDQAIDEAESENLDLADDSIDLASIGLDEFVAENLPLDYELLEADRAISDGIADLQAAAEEGTWADEKSTYLLAAQDFADARKALGYAVDELDADGEEALGSKVIDLYSVAATLVHGGTRLADLTSARESPTARQRSIVIGEATKLAAQKAALVAELPSEFGLPRSAIMKALEQTKTDLERASNAETQGAQLGALDLARDSKQRLEQLFVGASKVTITATDGWTHNEQLGKSRDCVDVSTTPPQAFISGTVSGPPGSAPVPMTAMVDGKIQVRVEISVAGDYTWKLTVYDAAKNPTGTFTVASHVQPPPTNQAVDPPCAAPTS